MGLQMNKNYPKNIRLPPDANRILFVRNLPFDICSEKIYEIFGKYGPIRHIRIGNTKNTKGTAYVVYEDIFDAKAACELLSGFNVQNRYLIILYHHNRPKMENQNQTSRKLEKNRVTGKEVNE